MSIIGVGVDIVNNNRLKKLIKNKNFLERVYTDKEKKFSIKLKNKLNYFSKRFAAKEAFSKALGTGISGGLKFNEIEVYNKNTGQPTIKVKGKTKNLINKILSKKKYKILLSVSDENFYALAMVVLLV